MQTQSESQAEVSTLEQDLKRSSEVVLDLERRLKMHEDEKGAYEKVRNLFYIYICTLLVSN